MESYVYYRDVDNGFVFWGRTGHGGQSGDRAWVNCYKATYYSEFDHRRLTSPNRPSFPPKDIPKGGTWYSCQSAISADLELTVAKKLRDIGKVDISTMPGSELVSRVLCDMLNQDDWLRP